MQITASFLSRISGEKRFQTIQDLVADGLITMYIDMYAKDYVDTMMISPAVKAGEKKNLDKDETKEKEPLDQVDATGKDQVFSTNNISQTFVIYYFPCLCSLHPPCLLRLNLANLSISLKYFHIILDVHCICFWGKSCQS